MRSIALSALLLLLLCTSVFSQEQPFSEFIAAINSERGGFAGNKEKLSTIFNAERHRLGDDFEAELLNYLGDDPEKRYWIGIFLTRTSYLHGSPAMPDLALDIWDKAIKTTRKAKETKAIGLRYNLSILAAILAHNLGKNVIALEYKSLGNRIIASGFDPAPYTPALDRYEQCIYKTIGGYTMYCKRDPEVAPPPKILVRGHVPTPNGGDPNNFRERVKVRIETDERGYVLKATITEGATAYHDRATALAKEVKLSPVKVSGEFLPMVAILTYYFK